MDEDVKIRCIDHINSDKQIQQLEKEVLRIINLDKTFRMTLIDGDWVNTTYIDPRVEYLREEINRRIEQIKDFYENKLYTNQ